MNARLKNILIRIIRLFFFVFGMPLVVPIAVLVFLIRLVIGQSEPIIPIYNPRIENYKFHTLMNILLTLFVALCYPFFALAALVDVFLSEENSFVDKLGAAINGLFPEPKYEETAEEPRISSGCLLPYIWAMSKEEQEEFSREIEALPWFTCWDNPNIKYLPEDYNPDDYK